MYYLGRPDDAFNVMRTQGLGITNDDLEEVPVFQKYKEKIEKNENAIEVLNQKVEELSKEIRDLKSDNANLISTSTEEVATSTKERNENAATPATPATPSSGNRGGGGGGLTPATPATPATPSVNSDKTAPVISGIQVSQVYATSAIVKWITDEDSTSVARYSATTTVYSNEKTGTTIASGTSYLHTVILENLTASTTYYFVVESEDGNGNLSVTGENNFVTNLSEQQGPELGITSFSIDPDNNRSTPTTTLVAEISDLNHPAGIAVNSGGFIYIVDYHGDNIKVYDANLNLVQTIGSVRGGAEGKFSEPWDVAIDGSDNVYIADTNNGRFQVFDKDGDFLYQQTGTGNSNQGISVNNDGYVYVSGRVVDVFDVDNNYVGELPVLDNNYYPRNVAIDKNNRVYFSNSGNCSMPPPHRRYNT